MGFDPEKDAIYTNIIKDTGFFYDSKTSKKLLSTLGYDDKNEFKSYNAIYPWTNEIIKKYYNYKKLTNKNALCVTASGDHALHAILAGATKIDSSDKNPLAKWYAMLKIALIKTYDLKNFKNQFNELPIRSKEPSILKPDIDLYEIKSFMDDDALKYWELVLKENTEYFNTLFRADGFKCDIENCCDYLNDKNFRKLKEKLKNANITYYDLDIVKQDNKFPLMYDAIFLSNIQEYYHNEDLLAQCGKLLNKNGVIYNYHCFGNIKRTKNEGLRYMKKINSFKDSGIGVSIHKKK